ncbi:hypothetical protein C2G38_2202811 [Gigaspora rosea]|uniref:Uncharacterized protein n=1 Tax=Gigaspora rosea TaxID=44941 RepID=A0A397USC3_9GLOM|nr:hypothetical protein C2G38_2202811 [Gigaspora rosea]
MNFKTAVPTAKLHLKEEKYIRKKKKQKKQSSNFKMKNLPENGNSNNSSNDGSNSEIIPGRKKSITTPVTIAPTAKSEERKALERKKKRKNEKITQLNKHLYEPENLPRLQHIKTRNLHKPYNKTTPEKCARPLNPGETYTTIPQETQKSNNNTCNDAQDDIDNDTSNSTNNDTNMATGKRQTKKKKEKKSKHKNDKLKKKENIIMGWCKKICTSNNSD